MQSKVVVCMKSVFPLNHERLNSQRPNCVKNDPCDGIKIRESQRRGEVGKKTHYKEMDNPSFL